MAVGPPAVRVVRPEEERDGGRYEEDGHGHDRERRCRNGNAGEHSACAERRDEGDDVPLHATCFARPSRSSASYTASMMMNVNPPPEFPQPPASAFARPTTFVSKNADVHAWQGTNVPPRIPARGVSPGGSAERRGGADR